MPVGQNRISRLDRANPNSIVFKLLGKLRRKNLDNSVSLSGDLLLSRFGGHCYLQLLMFFPHHDDTS